MKFTNAELMIRKREGKALRGLKELRQYVPAEHHDELKADLIARVKKLEGVKND